MGNGKRTTLRSSVLAVPDLDTRDLRMIVAIGDLRSVTQAAALLKVSQPALSRRLAELEERMGLALFVRSRRGTVPTLAGERVASRARTALGEIDAVRDEIRRGLVANGRGRSGSRALDEGKATHAA